MLTREYLSGILLKIIKAGLTVILLTPFAVVPQSFFPFIFWKTIIFRLVVELLLFFWVWLIILDKKFLPRRDWLFWSMAGFFIVLILSTIYSVNVYNSFWSNQERMEGLLTLLHFWVFFLILSSVLRHKADWLWFFKISFAMSVILSSYAFLQKINLAWSWVLFGGANRLSATMGNPAFLAGYLLISIFFGALLFLNAKKHSRSRWLILSLMIFELLILYWTATRGALLGITVAVVFFALMVFFHDIRLGFKKIAIIFLIGLVLFSACVYHYRYREWFIGVFGLGVYRVATISLDKASLDIQARLMAWQLAVDSWKQRPFLGWGLENYGIAFNTNFDPTFLRVSKQAWFDRAHSRIFDTLLANGALGLLAYLSIFGCAVTILIQRWLRSRRRDWVPLILLSALIGYFVQNLFVFDTHVTYLVFFSLLAFISFYGQHKMTSQEVDLTGLDQYKKALSLSAGKPVTKLTRQEKIFLGGLVFLIFLGMIKFNLKPAVANYNLGTSYAATSEQQAIERFKTAMFMHTFVQGEARREFARTIIAAANNLLRQKKALMPVKPYLDLAYQQIQLAIKQDPKNYSSYLYYGELARLLAMWPDNQVDLKGIDEALQIFYQAIDLAPLRPESYTSIADMQVSLGRYEEASQTYQKLLAFDPYLASAHWQYGLVLGRLNQPEAGWQELDKAVRSGYLDQTNNQSDFLTAARGYEKVQNWTSTIDAYQHYLKSAANDVGISLALAQAYANNSEISLARQIANNILIINPGLKDEVRKFLDSLVR